MTPWNFSKVAWSFDTNVKILNSLIYRLELLP